MKPIPFRFFKFLLLFMGSLLFVGCSNEPSNFENGKKKTNPMIIVDSSQKEKEGKSYQTIAAAFTYVNEHPPASEKERIHIIISEGIYREHLQLTAPYITLSGNGDAKETILTYYYGASNQYHSQPETVTIGTSASTVITESAHDFIAENLTFENSYNLYVTKEEETDFHNNNPVSLELRREKPWYNKYQTQAVALKLDADRSAFRNCRIISRQDTLYVNQQARCYLKDCYIEGTADFICGDATCVFEACTLNCPYNAGYVTASACSKNNPYGYLFKDCTISCIPPEGMEKPKDNDYSLGRPWRSFPQVIFWNCKMDSHIAQNQYRFIAMHPEYPCDACRFIEYGTMDIDGTPFQLDEIAVPYEILLSEEELERDYSIAKHLEAKFNHETQTLEKPDHWTPFGIE